MMRTKGKKTRATKAPPKLSDTIGISRAEFDAVLQCMALVTGGLVDAARKTGRGSDERRLAALAKAALAALARADSIATLDADCGLLLRAMKHGVYPPWANLHDLRTDRLELALQPGPWDTTSGELTH
jgi:hypothetical protein